MNSFTIPQLDHTDQSTLDTLLHKWQSKITRNRLRSVYYDTKNPLKDLGISIPPQLRNIETALGWPAKGVNALARRCNFDDFVVPGQEADPFGLAQIQFENSMELMVPQGITAALIHATAFLTTTRGDVASGEPEVVQNVRSALYGTGIWDARKRGFSSFLSIVETDRDDVPTFLIMYLPTRVLTMIRKGKVWRVFEQDNPLNRVPVEPLTYQPELERPFGHSRITRTAMSLTDQALRAMLRAEVSAEFYSSPQRYLLGASEEAFQDADGKTVNKWQAVMGRFLAIDVDEDGNKPDVGQFPQMSMEPHLAHLRQIAQNFASDQNLPISSLGIVQDNPASAEAIDAAKEELVVEAHGANRVFGFALVRSAHSAIMLRDGLTAPTPEMLRIRAKWRNPATPSQSSAADAIVKQVSAFPWMADSDVALEQLGYDETTIERLRVDRRRGQVGSLVASITGAATAASADPQVAALASARGNAG